MTVALDSDIVLYSDWRELYVHMGAITKGNIWANVVFMAHVLFICFIHWNIGISTIMKWISDYTFITFLSCPYKWFHGSNCCYLEHQKLFDNGWLMWLCLFHLTVMDFVIKSVWYWFPSVMQAAFLFTVVGTTGFLGVLAGQLPGVCSLTILLFCCSLSYLFNSEVSYYI